MGRRQAVAEPWLELERQRRRWSAACAWSLASHTSSSRAGTSVLVSGAQMRSWRRTSCARCVGKLPRRAQGCTGEEENGEGEESGVVDHSITLTCDFYIPDSYVGRMICHGEVQICIERGVGISSNLMLSEYG